MHVIVATEEGSIIGELEFAQTVAEWIEVLAIVVISAAIVIALTRTVVVRLSSDVDDALQSFKRTMARGLLVGLDLLIAADIIKTVTLEANLENATVLAILVLIRTFLSWTLILEVEDRWPWQPAPSSESTASDQPAG